MEKRLIGFLLASRNRKSTANAHSGESGQKFHDRPVRVGHVPLSENDVSRLSLWQLRLGSKGGQLEPEVGSWCHHFALMDNLRLVDNLWQRRTSEHGACARLRCTKRNSFSAGNVTPDAYVR